MKKLTDKEVKQIELDILEYVTTFVKKTALNIL